MATVGVIGGSGLYQIEGIQDVKEVEVKTPFGDPSDSIVVGNLSGVRCAFLPRHARGHTKVFKCKKCGQQFRSQRKARDEHQAACQARQQQP